MGRILGSGLTLLANGGASAPASPLLTDMISAWEMGESSAGAAPVTRNDSHGVYHLTDNNTTPSADGITGLAASMTAASSEYLSRADNADLSIGDRSFEMNGWIYVTSLAAGRTVAQKGSAFSATLMEFQVSISTAGGITIYMGNGSGTPAAFKANGTILVNTWYNVRFGYNKATGNIFIDVNNSGIATASLAGTPRDTSADLRFGVTFTPGATEYMNGRMMWWRRWNRVLTSDEATWLYNGGSGRSYADVTGYFP